MPIVETVLGGTLIMLLGTAVGAGLGRRGVLTEDKHTLLCKNMHLTISTELSIQLTDLKDELVKEIRNGKSTSTHAG